MPSTSQYRFADSHEWFHLDDEVVTIGISQFAADELTDITYVEMQPAGTVVEPGQPVGEVESVKTTSEVFSVVGGEIVEVNPTLTDDPGLVNTDPYGAGWLLRLRVDDAGPLDVLMDQVTYDDKHPVG